MKILQISSARVQYLGGTEKVVWELSKYMAKQGHEVTILQTDLYEKGSKWESIEKKEGINIITCKNDRFFKGFGYSKGFKQKLKEIWKDFDIVHIHGHGRFTSNWALKFLKEKKPIIYTAHGFFHSRKAGMMKKIYDKLFGRRLNNAIFCTALTKIEKEKYIQLGVPEKCIKIIPNWVDLKIHKRLKVFRKKVYSSLGLNPDLKTLLYVGRVHESKGLSYILEAIKDIDINFIVVGNDGSYMSQLKKEIVKLGLENRVIVTGPVNNDRLREIYSSSDFFVLFSEWEGFGIVVIEAMAYGLPVIVSDRGALPYLIKDGENGQITPFGNISKLSEKIKKYLDNPSFAKKISSVGKEFVKDYDTGKIVREYEKLYEEARRV